MPQTTQTLLDFGPHLFDTLVPGQRLLERAMAQAPPQARWLQQLKGAIGRSLPAAEELKARQLLEQYTNVLHTLAQSHPLLLVLDDLQWVDEASASLLFHVGHHLAGVRILVAGAYRPEEVALGRGGGRHPLDKALAEFKRRYGDVWLDLDQVEGGEGWQFVNALLDHEPNCLDDNFRQALYDQTRGYPLFTVELLRAIRERGDLVVAEDGCWTASPDLDWKTLPARIEGVIEERIGRLEDELCDILTVSSVEGEEFTAQVVARVQNLGERQLLRILSQELDKRHRLVKEQKADRLGRRWLSRYRFAHALFQRYLYGELGEGERALLHREVAAVLEDLYAECPEELRTIAGQMVHHYAMAGDDEQERVYARLAGEGATAQLAYAEAVAYLSRALALTPETDLSERYALLLTRQKAYRELGNMTGEEQDLETLEALAPHLGEACRAEVSLRRARVAQRTGDWQAAEEATQAAVAWARNAGNLAHELDGRLWLAWKEAQQSNFETARAEAERALTLARQAALREKEARALITMGLVHFYEGDRAAPEPYYEQALSIYRAVGNRSGEMRALSLLGETYGELGRLAESRDVAMQCLRQARQTGRREAEGNELNNLGLICMQIGDYTGARDYFEQSLNIFRSMDWQRSIDTALGNLSIAQLELGDAKTALTCLEQCVPIARDIGFLYGLGIDLTMLGHTLTALDQPEEAATAYGEAVETLRAANMDHQAMASLAGLARLSLARGEPEQALRHVEQILDHIETKGTVTSESDPLRVYLTCYQVLCATGDGRAPRMLLTTYSELQRRAANIGDEEMRRSFLENVPTNQEILRRWTLVDARPA
jgi:tetratricopeptide (TPR) repeat protein